MRLIGVGVFAVSGGAMLAALVLPGTAALGQAGPADAGKRAFAACAVCHAVTPGTNKVGPSLHGVVGRKIGSVAGYAYSPALKTKGGVWNEAALDAYIAAPQTFAKGTKMAYPPQRDAARRAAIIAYLKTLK